MNLTEHLWLIASQCFGVASRRSVVRLCKMTPGQRQCAAKFDITKTREVHHGLDPKRPAAGARTNAITNAIVLRIYDDLASV